MYISICTYQIYIKSWTFTTAISRKGWNAHGVKRLSDRASPWRESKAAKEPTDGWYGRPTTWKKFSRIEGTQAIEEHIIDTLDVYKKQVCIYI